MPRLSSPCSDGIFSSLFVLTRRFLWNIVLSATYRNNLVYSVRGTFTVRLGRLPGYWLALVCAFVACITYDIAIITLRVTFFPKDADTFAELERDPLIKTRFEEEAASELQQSWNRGKSTKRDIEDHPCYLEEGRARRAIVDAWNSTPKPPTSNDDHEQEPQTEAGATSAPGLVERRQSFTHTGFDIGCDDEPARRFGAVIRKPFKRLPASDAI